MWGGYSEQSGLSINSARKRNQFETNLTERTAGQSRIWIFGVSMALWVWAYLQVLTLIIADVKSFGPKLF